ncbi:MAG: hypothetical protein M5U28_13740 [Sandaracinaceae bacterium]|nr:hypothetical protein [Sandaracinaceae bacterium]
MLKKMLKRASSSCGWSAPTESVATTCEVLVCPARAAGTRPWGASRTRNAPSRCPAVS